MRAVVTGGKDVLMGGGDILEDRRVDICQPLLGWGLDLSPTQVTGSGTKFLTNWDVDQSCVNCKPLPGLLHDGLEHSLSGSSVLVISDTFLPPLTGVMECPAQIQVQAAGWQDYVDVSIT